MRIRCHLKRAWIFGRAPVLGLLVGLLAAGGLLPGCEGPGGQGRAPAPVEGMEANPAAPVPAGRPAPRAKAPTGPPCEIRCNTRGACLEGFRRLGAPPVLGPLPPGAPADCLGRCRRAERDPTLAPIVQDQHRRCVLPGLEGASAALACDALYGCLVRERLTLLQRDPWRRTVLEGRLAGETIAARLEAGRARSAVTRCRAQGALRRELKRLLGAGGVPAKAAQDALTELDRRCRAALEARLEALAQAIEAAVKDLKLDAADRACRQLEPLKTLPWRPEGEAPAARLAEASRSCGALDPLRALATSVADAEADTALVNQELDRGGHGVAAYHKCVHKAATLKALETSTHPRAKAAAKALRRACFERFPVEWLREAQRSGTTPDRARCYRITLVSRLITARGAPAAYLAKQQALLKWARERCP